MKILKTQTVVLPIFALSASSRVSFCKRKTISPLVNGRKTSNCIIRCRIGRFDKSVFEPDPDPDPDPDVVLDPIDKSAFDPDPNAALDPEPNAALDPDPNVALDPDPNVALDPDPNVVLDPDPNVVLDPDPKVVLDPIDKSVFDADPSELVLDPIKLDDCAILNNVKIRCECLGGRGVAS